MAVGTVGGTLHAHAGARLALRLLGVTDAKTLAMVIGSVGLASNLAALRALATRGHPARPHGAAPQVAAASPCSSRRPTAATSDGGRT